MAKMVRIDIRLTPKQEAWVRCRAAASGQSQSAVLRAVVEEILDDPIEPRKRARAAKRKDKSTAKRVVRKRTP